MNRLSDPDVWSNIFFVIVGVIAACSQFRLPELMGTGLVALGIGSAIDHYRAPDTSWTLDRMGIYLTYSLLAYLAYGGGSPAVALGIWVLAALAAISETILELLPSFLVIASLGILIIGGAVIQATVGEALVSTALVLIAFGLRYLDQEGNGQGLHAAWHFMMAITTLGIYGLIG